jgi:hypothetical protein
MVVAFMPGAARDESHRDRPVVQRESAVHRSAVEFGEEPAKPVHALSN